VASALPSSPASPRSTPTRRRRRYRRDDGADSNVELTALPDRAAAEAAIDDRDLPAAIVIPAGFAASLTGDAAASGPLAVEVLVDPGRQLPSDVAVAIATRLAAGVDATGLPSPPP
jgi:hypothetical protein